MKRNKYVLVAFAAILTFSYGCKKSYLETTPSSAVTDANLYATTTSCYQVIDGIARLMNTTGASYEPLGGGSRVNDFGESSVRFTEDHMGNDMVDVTNGFDWFFYAYNYVGPRQPTYNAGQMGWRLYYKIINSANLLLDNIDKAQGPEEEIANLKGQAYAFRAYAYYKLSIYHCKTYSSGRNNLGLPIYLHGTTASSPGLPRSTVGEVYDQIVADLAQARTNLEAGGSISGRPSSDISLATFYGINAKVALVMENWQVAKDMADLAMSTFGGSLMSVAEYKAGFNSKSNPEWMWSSNLSASQRQEMGNRNFMSFVDPSNPTSYASTGLGTNMAKATLDVMKGLNDVRATTFTATRQQTKFHLADPSGWEFDLLYMRLAEMYLIKAEAQAELGDAPGAVATLTTLVRARNPDYNYNSNVSRYTQANSVGQSDAAYFGRTSLLKEIYLQRRIELFLEGVAYADIQRWHCGLKRPSGQGNFTKSTAGVLTLPADDNGFLFKIPQQEMDSNPAMAGQQNP
jgi:starch-binding outer membrane protein, SusD/RagB family